MNVSRLPYSVTVAGSSALLFVVQPMAAKMLLPRFGGSAGVWVACMMFFQIMLLAGYLYSYCITRFLGPRTRTAVHLALLALSLAALPVRLPADPAPGHPTLSILLTLAASVGLPFFLLSTTSPLVQSWYAGSRGAYLPYRLFAMSNVACLLALVAYPVAIEPALAVPAQLHWWSIGYAAMALLTGIGAIDNRAWTAAPRLMPRPGTADDAVPRPWLWIALAACASTLWLAVANYLSQEVAAIPFLWVAPLTLYLLSFVICFEWDWYRPAWFRWLLPAAWLLLGSRIGLGGSTGDLRIDIPALLAALFALCLFCHGELARTKPAPHRGLAFFYLMTAAGGALGGVFVGVAAPAVFPTYLELPIGVVASVLLALVLIYRVTSRGRLLRLGGLAIAAFVAATTFRGGVATVARERNFYGVVQVGDSGEGDRAVRSLYNGRTVHGLEFLAPALRQQATAYYGKVSGIGTLFGALPEAPRRVAIIGLGAGTLATYGRAGDFFRFYEINPAVIEAARAHFHFLADSAASTDVVRGDGRLRLEQEPRASFDLIVLDAFSDDAIPVHLLTRQAFEVYFARLRGSGPLAIHLTNRYLDLNPVVESLAAALHKAVLRVHSDADPATQTLAADWAIVANGHAAAASRAAVPLWTDEYSNLFQVWK